MVEGEDISEGSVSSFDTGFLFSSQNENTFSPEDMAWVDSCLTDAPGVSGSDLNPLRDALMDIIDNYPEMSVSSSRRTQFSAIEDDMGVPSSETEEHGQRTDEDLSLLTHGEAEIMNNSSLTEDVIGVSALLNFEENLSKNSLHVDFLSVHQNGSQTANETHDPLDSNNGPKQMVRLENGAVSDAEVILLSPKVSKDDDLGASLQDTSMPHDNVDAPFVNSVVLEDQIEFSSKDIFKVWDLEIPVDGNEEDEFEQQLKKALDKTATRQSLSRPVDDPVVLENSSIDDLIAGISDLSLNKTFT